MSKFIDELHKISRGEVHRLGFGAAQPAAAKIPALALVVAIPKPDANLVKIVAEGGVDGLLIKMGSLEKEVDNLEAALKAAGEVPCGVTLETCLPGDLDRLISLGADFVALHTETAPSAILRKEEVGRVAIIDPYLDDILLRTLDALSIDALLVLLEQGNEEFLTLQEVMACRRVIGLARKPVMLHVSSKLGSDDLASVRDLGIESVLIDLVGEEPKDVLSRMRKVIEELPPRRKPREHPEAVLPQAQPSPKVSEPEEDGEP